MINYNNARYIQEAIDSVINQTFKEWELIIIDDASTDNSIDIINTYLINHPKQIKLISHTERQGIAKSRRESVNLINSNLFGILDSDDALLPEAIEVMYNAHINNPDCGLIYSQFMYCDENLKSQQIGFCRNIPIGQTNLNCDAISHFQTFKKSSYDLTEGYYLTSNLAEDKDIFYKMEEVSFVKFIDQILYLHRVHNQNSSKGTNVEIAKMAHLQIKQEAEERRGEPLFSAIIINYNNANYISDAIESIINQTFKNWELIIVDDCSTDNSVNIIKQYVKRYPLKIRCIQHKTNKGCSSSWITGIENITTNIFGMIDSDDALQPEAIEVMYRAHVDYPNCGLIYSQFDFCDENLKFLREGYCGEISTNQTILSTDLASHFKTIKLNAYLTTSGFDPNIKSAVDKDILCKIEEVTDIKFINQSLYLYREHNNQTLSQFNNMKTAVLSFKKVKETAKHRRQNSLSIIFPYKYIDQQRQRLLNFTMQYYKDMFPMAQIIIGEDDNNSISFCKARAINHAMEQVNNINIAIIDIDMLIPKENMFISLKKLEQYSYVIPYTNLLRLDMAATSNILKKGINFNLSYSFLENYKHQLPTIAGGVQIFRRKVFEGVGGYDERFKGWGGEDYAFPASVTAMYGKGVAISGKGIHLWHPVQSDKALYLQNNHPNRDLYFNEYHDKNDEFILNVINKRKIALNQKANIAILQDIHNPHYMDHILPIWNHHLLSQYKDRIYNNIALIPKDSFILVAGKVEELPNHKLILVNHGAGQAYQPHNNSSYAGGRNRDNVQLFIQPNQYAADLDQQKYPNAKQVIAGCSKLDKWHQRKLNGEIKNRGSVPVIAISFHFDCQVCPETRSAFEYYKSALDMLAYKNITKEWIILGHGHPRMIGQLEPYYKKCNIEVVHDFNEIMERADLYIMDHMSTLYEFASTDRPVVVLNAPWYRKNVEHGLRYWKYADVGINVEHPDQLEPAIYRALEDPLEQKMKRERACNAVYAYRDGMCTERAAQAIINYLKSLNQQQGQSNSDIINKQPSVKVKNAMKQRRIWYNMR